MGAGNGSVMMPVFAVEVDVSSAAFLGDFRTLGYESTLNYIEHKHNYGSLGFMCSRSRSAHKNCDVHNLLTKGA